MKEIKHCPTTNNYSTEFEEFLKWKEQRYSRPSLKTKVLPKPYKGNPSNVLVIGDLHAPFILEGYLEFCREEQEKWDCGTVIFIGDIVDGHSWSFHEHNVDGMSVKSEVTKAKQQLEEWYSVFPEAVVLLGNHDLLVSRKAKSAGLSQHFIKDLGEILGAPKTWMFTHEFVKDDVKYVHGSTGNAITRAKDERISIVQGHLHTESFVEWAVSERDAIFGMNVGCGLDHSAYAFEYAKPFPKKPVISLGIVLENGKLPFTKLMNL
jgi:predicted MPP superfamily phosphohydrolase